MNKVSCILINYNTAGFTLNAVKSILDKQQSPLEFEIIVVDNASAKEDFSVLEAGLAELEDPRVQLLKSELNTGFGGGNMIGVGASNAEYYAFINNDTLQTETDILTKLVDFMESHPDAGMCSPQMLDEHGKFRVTIDHYSSPAREILRRPMLEFLFPRTFLNRKKTYEEPVRVHYVQGSFMFMRASDFHDVGGFDPNLFLYYEESDLCLRLKKLKGLHTYLVPGLTYIHYKSQSIERTVRIKTEQKIAMLYHTKKHYGRLARGMVNIYLAIRYFFTSLIKPKYWSLFKVLAKGAPLSESIGSQIQKKK